MKKKNKWFKNSKGYGYIEYKQNGKILIYLSINGILKEFELNKIKD